MKSLLKYVKNECAQSMVEYACIIAVVVMATIGVLMAFSNEASEMYVFILDRLGGVFVSGA